MADLLHILASGIAPRPEKRPRTEPRTLGPVQRGVEMFDGPSRLGIAHPAPAKLSAEDAARFFAVGRPSTSARR